MKVLYKENTCYVLLHFEQVFNNLFLDSSINVFSIVDGTSTGQEKTETDYNELWKNHKNATLAWAVKGIYQRSLTQITILKIRKEIDDIKKDRNIETVVFDMKRILDLGGNNLTEFEHLLDDLIYHRHKWLLINTEEEIQIKGRNAENNYFMSSIDAFTDEECSFYSMQIDNIFREELENYLQSCSYQYNRISISSRVYLSKYIDIKKMLTNMPFFCLCMYKLANVLSNAEILSIDKYDDNYRKSIFIHTMSSAVMGSILAQLFCLDLVIVDHLGPYNKLYVDDLAATIDRHKKYIVVSDVVCMGSELKIAKTILDVLGIQYECCAALVEIETVEKKEKNDIYSLYKVTKEHNTLEYYVNTDLSETKRE